MRRLLLGFTLLLGSPLWAAQPPPVDDPIPPRTQGEGPFPRVVLRNVTIVNGTGAPAQGPFDLVLVQDRIAEIRSIGTPGAIDASKRAERGEHEIDLTGHYVLPGFVDTHAHLHSLAHEQKVPADYVLKLWMAHGVTSVREVGSHKPIEWMVGVKQRSARNEIVAPRIDVYPMFHEILETPINDAQSARLAMRSEEHTSELQSRLHLVCRLLLEKKNHRLSRPRIEWQL